MPTITLEEFDRRVSAEKGAIIIVPNKYSKEFTNSPTNIIATEVGKMDHLEFIKFINQWFDLPMSVNNILLFLGIYNFYVL